MQGHSKVVKRRKAAILIYTAWNPWKERNRRVFQGLTCSSRSIASIN
ncbi:hypothetical protein HU200_021658 [Digitaria exilis]|uniref:Uncharacterized protein n=1 Tax=Digitaria exilis TaxID=1010633 RepID=A0A835K970_9POAL|nr:hypothetical protein HU200_021658 [Digitaria exilis]